MQIRKARQGEAKQCKCTLGWEKVEGRSQPERCGERGAELGQGQEKVAVMATDLSTLGLRTEVLPSS